MKRSRQLELELQNEDSGPFKGIFIWTPIFVILYALGFLFSWWAS